MYLNIIGFAELVCVKLTFSFMKKKETKGVIHQNINLY